MERGDIIGEEDIRERERYVSPDQEWPVLVREVKCRSHYRWQYMSSHTMSAYIHTSNHYTLINAHMMSVCPFTE